MTLTLLGEPRSTGHIYRYACRGRHPAMYMTKAGKTLKESYQWQARDQYQGRPLSCPLSISVAIFPSTRRRFDIDNAGLKLLFDAMNGLVWEDDVQIEEMIVMKRYDKDNPRIELTVNKLP